MVRGTVPAVREIMSRPFLTATWKHLAFLNYPVEPSVLAPHVPAGTEVDLWNGQAFVSVVAFLFLDAKVGGAVPIPFHQEFEEINLRFYVRRRRGGEVRRGVVFVKEIVSSAAVALAARAIYGENYVALETGHRLRRDERGDVRGGDYWFGEAGKENRIELDATGPFAVIQPGTKEEFQIVHAWGYTRQSANRTLEYSVSHPPWRAAPAAATLVCDVAGLYGEEFAAPLAGLPESAYLVDGSEVAVYPGKPLEPQTRS
jgi:uncharacterized protein YqjF (DUF2071 family)